MLTRDEIRSRTLDVATLPRESIEVPEWGGSVCVREMTALERDRFERMHLASKADDGRPSGENFRARLCVACVCDDKGALLFSDEDLAWLGGGSCRVLDRVAEVALRLNGFTKSDVETLEKN